MKNFVSKFIKIITFPLYLLAKFLLLIYKGLISPFLPHVCKFKPSCSKYFSMAISEYGVFYGSILGIKRILRCNPFSKGGYDPVKFNIKGKIKWIL